MKLIASLFFSFLFFTAGAQVKTDTTYRLPAGERLHYKIYYKLGNIWINAGFANLNADTLTADSSLRYVFTAEGYSLKKYSWIYTLEDHYKSVVNANTLTPVRFEKENTEGGVWVHDIYNFDYPHKTVDMFMESTGKQPVHKTGSLNGFITDALSATYYIRTFDFDSFDVGDTLIFKTILDGKIFDQSLIYLGKDSVKTSKGDVIPAFKLNALIENSTFFRGDDAVKVWITDNNERWIAKAKAQIIIGSIIVYLDKRGLVSFNTKN